MSYFQNEKRKYSFKKIKNELNQNLNQPQTLEEYFLIIGIEPKICLKEYLYYTAINELNENYSKEDLKPKILSKYPPFNKKYINIDESFTELCFPNGYKIEKFDNQPKPEILHFLLDNSFYSIDYPLKYVSCLKIYESLENYLLLFNEIKDTFGDEYFHNIWEMNKKKKNENNILKAIGNVDMNNYQHNERFNSEIVIKENYFNNYNEDSIKNYYFPKMLCLVSTQHFFNEQKQILEQIYQYFLENKTKKIPLEKIILTILFNIPIPPKGLLDIHYKLKDTYQVIKIEAEKMNEIENLNDELSLIFSKFSINKVIILLKYILIETKTIVFSTKINELTYFIYGIISLLFPFHYSFQVSSSISSGAYDLLESISPFILGINSKFKKSFFKKNKIDLNDLNLLIVDLDEKSLKTVGSVELPEFPSSLIKNLSNGLEELFIAKNKKNIADKIDNKLKNARKLFYDFLVNLLSDYDLYLKTDFFKNKISNTGIKHLFKIQEFVDSHPHNEKEFFKKFTETQMFSDFIYKKMIPKNIQEKLEILLVDETLIKKKNKNLFSKKKSTIFLDSKEYEYNNTYVIPQTKFLAKREKDCFINENYRNNCLFYGQKITVETDQKNEENYSFEYYLFPILINYFFEYSPSGEYFLAPDSILFSDVDRANTDLLSQSMNCIIKNKNKNNEKEEMKNYIYLTYIELWAYTYWYFDFSEKEEKFKELLEILNKVTNHEVELFDILIEALNKFKETDKILKLYDCLLKYKIAPSSFIYSTVNSLLNKNNKSGNFLQKSNSIINTDIIVNEKKNQKRTFHSLKEGTILGDKVIFFSKQPCLECEKEIDIIELSRNFKNMKKEMFWIKCPFCGKDIIPKINVVLGNEINNLNENNIDNNNINTSKYTTFVLHSPYELKNNIKNIIKKDGFKIFNLEIFKAKYPSLFWSCVWYFKMIKINIDIILPYEYKSVQDMDIIKLSLPNNILSLVKTEMDKKNKNDGNNGNKINIKKSKKNKNNKKDEIKKYSTDKLLIHNAISFQIDDNNYIKYLYFLNKSSTGSICDLYRKSTLSSINKSNTININNDKRNSADNSKINLFFNTRSNISKKNSVKYNMPYNLRKIKLNNYFRTSILSTSLKPRRLFKSINSSDLLSIKESEDYLYVSPFTKDIMKEENYEDDYLDEGIYSNKISIKIFNFEDDELNIFGYRKNRSFNHNKIDDEIIKNMEAERKKRNNSVKNKKINFILDY